MIVDTHCHLEKKDYDNIDNIVNKMKDNIIIACGCDDFSNKELYSYNYKNVYKCFGIHPENVDNYKQSDIDFIEQHIKDIVAIGEIGLDYYYSKDNIYKQKELFIKQLDLAQKYKIPVIVHSRDSIQDTYDILKNYKLKVDIHCFSSSLEMAQLFIKLGYKIGIGGVVTFKNASKLIDIVKQIDLNNILLETDSPYLTPVPFRGCKNEPYNVHYVANKIAEIKNISVEEVMDITTKNALDFFNIKE